MDECMISVVWRCLSEGGGVREQAAVVITYWDDEVRGWVRTLGGLGFGRGLVALLDEPLLFKFLVVKTGILDRRVGWK